MCHYSSSISALPRSWRLLYLTLGALIAAGLWYSASSSATAHHPKTAGPGDTNQLHIYSQHTTATDEWYCTDSHYAGTGSTDLSEANMEDRIYEALERGDANGFRDWDFGTGYKISLIRTIDEPCDSIPLSNKLKYRLEYHGWRTGTDPLKRACGSPGQPASGRTSCAVAYDILDPSGSCRAGAILDSNCDKFADDVTPNQHANYYVMNLQSAWLGDNSVDSDDRGRWLHVVQHETGHAFGLVDPPRVSSADSPSCRGNDSVMEQQYFYGCRYNKWWPTTRDTSEVIAINADTDDSGTYDTISTTTVGEDDAGAYTNQPDAPSDDPSTHALPPPTE